MIFKVLKDSGRSNIVDYPWSLPTDDGPGEVRDEERRVVYLDDADSSGPLTFLAGCGWGGFVVACLFWLLR
jgi:hypothetical protein